MRPLRRAAGEWYAARRDRLSIILIAAVALGGIVCMFLAVLVLIAAGD